MAKKPKKAPEPSEEAKRAVWEITLFQYVQRREYQTLAAIKETEKLFAIFREEANNLYRVADRLERWGARARDETHPGAAIERRIVALGYGQDGAAQRVLRKLVDPSPEIPHTPTDLRSLAGLIKNEVEYEEVGLNDCKEQLERSRTKKQAGRRPKSAFHVLLVRATNQGIGDAELARRLVAAGVAPETLAKVRGDPVEQWRAIIKAARRRLRIK